MKIEIDTKFYSFWQHLKDTIYFGNRESFSKWFNRCIFHVEREASYTYIDIFGIGIYIK